jgi:CO/xanthine dehydrogenase Mo-binding subunit
MPLRYGNDRRCCERRGWLRLQQQMPGVHAVLTGEDWAADGLGTLDPEVMAEDMGGPTGHRTKRPPLAQGRVRYVGERVGFVGNRA